MKKISVILSFFVLLNFSLSCNIKCFSYQQKNTYAKALDNCVLYKSVEMKDIYDDIYFFVPESYFVVVLEYVSNDCIKVQYDKYIGYVKASYIVLAKFTPIVKTLDNIKLDIKETSGTQIWNKPTTAGAVLTTIPAGYKQINYISKTIGDVPYGGVSNIWYYVNFVPFENSTNVYEGYIYSENTTNLDEIILNAETNPEIEVSEVVDNTSNFNISSTFKTIIVSLISIPIILFFVVIMYKIVKKIKENTNDELKHQNENIDNYNNFQNIKSENLKSKINSMRGEIYTKQNKFENGKNAYPKFPMYDSDDDLL